MYVCEKIQKDRLLNVLKAVVMCFRNDRGLNFSLAS